MCHPNYARATAYSKMPAVCPELEQRREAVALADLLKAVRPDDPQYAELSRRLALLELKLRRAGLNTDFYVVNMQTGFRTKLMRCEHVPYW